MKNWNFNGKVKGMNRMIILFDVKEICVYPEFI